MDMKQIDLPNDKTMFHHNSIKGFIHFVDNLEKKLSSLQIIHEKLYDFISILSKTHENIIDELTNIKIILNEKTIQQKQDQDEIIPIDQTKSEWDQQEENQSKRVTKLSSTDAPISINSRDRLSSCSPSSYVSSSTNSSNNENGRNSSLSKRSSNLKKSDQSSTRTKSSKSVTFYFDQNKDSTKSIIEKQPIEKSSIKTNDQITTSIIPNSNEISAENLHLIPHLFKQHHNEVTTKPNIGYQMGTALTNVRIHEIEPINGDYLRLLNISNSDDYDLSEHYLQQNVTCVPLCRFHFPSNTIIKAGQTLTVWCGPFKDIEEQPPHIFIWKEQRRWQTGPECVTILAKPTGQAIAWARSSHRINNDQSSNSKYNIGSFDSTSFSSNSFNRSRLSAFNFIGNKKASFADSSNIPIHANHNGSNSNKQNDLRSKMHQTGGICQLLNRPKSSPFASHTGCKQDLISMNILRKQPTQQHKQTTLQT